MGIVRENGRCGRECYAVSVDVRTGELFFDKTIFSFPGEISDAGVIDDNAFSLRWRSMISGTTQFGRQVLGSLEVTAEKVIVNQGTPNAPGGHFVHIRQASGRLDKFDWDGAAYQPPPDVFDTLTVNGAGEYELEDKWGYERSFHPNGMPASATDRKGNTDNYTYTGYRLTSYTDEKGRSYTLTHDASGYVSSISDPAGRTWNFTYDANANLKTIKTPGSQQQPAGVTTTLNYDGQDRLAAVKDGRSNTVWQVSYVGASGQVSSITAGSSTISYSYVSGVTTRTDRNGNVHRYFYTGNQVTKTDMLVDGSPKYVTQFGYSGVFLTKTVYPRGNRVDLTRDAVGNVLERRHRTQDTNVNDPSDIVHTWTYVNNWATSRTDPRGNTWTFTRASSGNITQITHPTVTNPTTQTSSWSAVYNSRGQETSITDEKGNVTTFEYYQGGVTCGLLKKITVDPGGLDLVTTFTYDSHGNIATITDPRGNVTTRTWDNLRRLVEIKAPSPLSYRVKFEYDGNGNLTKQKVENIDKDGNQDSALPWITTTYTYTQTGDLETIVEDIDATTTRTTTLEYDGNQNRIRATRPESNKVKWEYNERDWVVKHIRGESDPKESTSEFVYDENGNKITEKDGRGNATTHTFDLFDRLTKSTNPLGHYGETEYDKNGNVTKIVAKDSADVELQRETYFLDERNRHWKTSALFKTPTQTLADAVTTIERLKTGHPKTITNPRGMVTTYEYDAASRIKKVTDPLGNKQILTLDANGNLTDLAIEETDGTTTVTHDYEFTYDVLNRRTEVKQIDRLNAANVYTTTHSYDSRSNRVFKVDPENKPTRWTFDAISRMVKREMALTVGATIDDFLTAQVTMWGFDKNDRLTLHDDDATDRSSWTYDALDRPTKQTLADTKTLLYEYDAADNLTKMTDPAGNVIDQTYDTANRLTGRTITLATGFLGTTSETRTYDATNNALTLEDNDYKIEYEHSNIGLNSYVASEKQSYVGMTAYPKTVSRSHDANGNTVTTGYPTGANLSITLSYDGADQLTGISDGTNAIAGVSHLGWRRQATTFQNGAQHSNTFSGFRDEITTLHHQTSAQSTIVQLDYAYNKAHNKTYERFGGAGSSGDAYEYDGLHRLVTAWVGSSNPSAPVGASYTKKIEYDYDDDGNRTSVKVTPWQQGPTTTSYSANNVDAYTSVGGTTHTWDANGNLTDNGTFLFEYDYRNQVARVKKKSDSSVVATYRYDPLGRRVEKSTGDVERYIYSSGQSAVEAGNLGQVVAVYDGSDNWQQNFVWDQDVDGVVMLEQADVLDYDDDGNTTEITRSFYHLNSQGSVAEITDMNEAVVASYRYDPYSAVTITRNGQSQSSDPLGQHWTFTGRFHDEETGLYYYRARVFDPELGRFIQRDPLGLQEGPNAYVYTDSNPGNWTDPTGLNKKAYRDCLKKALENYRAATAAIRAEERALQREMQRLRQALSDLRSAIANAGATRRNYTVTGAVVGTGGAGAGHVATIIRAASKFNPWTYAAATLVGGVAGYLAGDRVARGRIAAARRRYQAQAAIVRAQQARINQMKRDRDKKLKEDLEDCRKHLKCFGRSGVPPGYHIDDIYDRLRSRFTFGGGDVGGNGNVVGPGGGSCPGIPPWVPGGGGGIWQQQYAMITAYRQQQIAAMGAPSGSGQPDDGVMPAFPTK